MTGTTVIALAGSIGGPAVGAIAIIAANLGRRGDREHALALADRQHDNETATRLSQRLFEQRTSVYEELSRYIVRTQLTIDRTHPVFGPAPPVPVQMPEDEWIKLEGRVALFGSQHVLDALMAYSTSRHRFFAVAGNLELISSSAGPGQQVADTRVLLDERRAETHTACTELQRMIREELATL